MFSRPTWLFKRLQQATGGLPSSASAPSLNAPQRSASLLNEPVDASLSELLKKVRQVEIKTRGLSNHLFSGEYHSAFKGRGMSFSEVREYQFGDDVRSIDWNVTARMRTPHIKVFEEERELTLMLLVDISASTLFGTGACTKKDIITELCAILAFSAIQNHDKVGILFFSDTIEKYIPPKKGKTHVLHIIRELLSMQPRENAQTDIGKALRFLQSVIKSRSICFVLSDFLSTDYQAPLRLAAGRHDLVGVHIYDPADLELPPMGMIHVMDPETGQHGLFDTNNNTAQHLRKQYFLKHAQFTKQTLLKAGADCIQLHTNHDHLRMLQTFFKSRIK
jgi:uncharacterized protein (DUF58 family)